MDTENENNRSANFLLAFGFILLGLIFHTYVFHLFDYSGFMVMGIAEHSSMTVLYTLLSIALILVAGFSYRKGEHLAALLFFFIGLMELVNGLSFWHGHVTWEGCFIILAVLVMIVAVIIFLQGGNLVSLTVGITSVLYFLDALLPIQSNEVLATIMGALFILPTVLFFYLGAAIIVNEELEEDLLPIF